MKRKADPDNWPRFAKQPKPDDATLPETPETEQAPEVDEPDKDKADDLG